MPKIMKANFLQTIFLKEQIKMLRNKIGLDQFTHGIDIDIVQIIFTVAVTTHRTVNTLLCSEITEQQFKRCNKWKCTATRLRFGRVLLHHLRFTILIELNNGMTDADGFVFKINRIPLESYYFTTAQSIECAKDDS